MNEYTHRNIAWVAAHDNPLETQDRAVHEVLSEMNELAPKGFEWVYTVKGEPGFMLLSCAEEVDA